MEGRDERNKVQAQFLRTVKQQQSEVEMSLSDGEKVVGRILSFDAFTILVKTSTKEYLVFKNSICRIHEL